jgi:hypothetical protein
MARLKCALKVAGALVLVTATLLTIALLGIAAQYAIGRWLLGGS